MNLVIYSELYHLLFNGWTGNDPLNKDGVFDLCFRLECLTYLILVREYEGSRTNGS